MKPHPRSQLLALIFALFSWAFSPALYGETWYITSLDWAPYSDSKAKDQGFLIKRLRHVLKSKNIELMVEFYPWFRAKALAQNKEYVGYFPAWPEEVEKGFVASRPVGWSKIGLLANLKYASSETDLNMLIQSNSICTVRTYTYPKIISGLLNKNAQNVLAYTNEEAMARALSNQLCSIAITDPKVILFNAKKQGINNLQVIQPELYKKELVLSFRNEVDNFSKIKLLNLAIDQFKE